MDGCGADDDTPSDAGPIERLRRLLAALADLDPGARRRGAGHLEGNGIGAEYGYSVGTDLGNGRVDDRDGRDDSTDPSGDRSGPTWLVDADDAGAGGHYRVAASADDERLAVVADLPGVDPDAAAVRVDDEADRLAVLVDGDVVEAIPLPAAGATVETVRFNNGVLSAAVRLDDPAAGDVLGRRSRDDDALPSGDDDHTEDTR